MTKMNLLHIHTCKLGQDAIDQLMDKNKMSDTRESSITPKTDMDDEHQKDVNSRRNVSGYSWWKWRRSTDSVDKKSPSKDMPDGIESQTQSVDGTADEMKDDQMISDLDTMTIIDGSKLETKLPNDEHIELSLKEMQHLDVHHAELITKNDDSISSELADVSKSSFPSEKYRKTLRLTSEQIVRSIFFFHWAI